MNRYSAAALMLALLVLISACSNKTVDSTTLDTEEVTVLETEVKGFLLNAETALEFAVIRGDMSSDIITKSAVSLRNEIAELIGYEIKISTDWEKSPFYKYELIVGNTLRPEQLGDDIDFRSVGERGYLIACSESRLYICGGSDEGTLLGVDWFRNNILNAAKNNIEIEDGYCYRQEQQYDIPALLVDSKDTKEWKIVCNSTDGKKAAKLLQDVLYKTTGCWHEITDEDSGVPSFYLGFTVPELTGIFRTYVQDGSLWFSTSSKQSGIEGCVSAFLNTYIYSNTGAINFPDGFEYTDLGDYIIVYGLN